MSEYVLEIIQELKLRMNQEGAKSEGAFDDLLDGLINEWVELGKIHEDVDIENIKSQVRASWIS